MNSRDEIGETALTKARQKLAFFDIGDGEKQRQLYQTMIGFLLQAGAIE